MKISIVTPTYLRPQEIKDLLLNLCKQTRLPEEVIVADGAPPDNRATEDAISEIFPSLLFRVVYARSERGTAVQRNRGIEMAKGELIALFDDDVRLEPDFLQQIVEVFSSDPSRRIGGITGYRTNRHFDFRDAARWRWYRRLRLLTTYEPGRYDFKTGYPINTNLQPPFTGTREIDFMTTACSVWRSEVFRTGLRFDPFFRDYGVLEDAHFSLRAGKDWKLLQCGDARCEELHSPNGRVDRRKIGYKCVVNYYYVFRDVAQPLGLGAKLRFWRFQLFELLRIALSALRRGRGADLQDLLGRLEGMAAVARGAASKSGV